MPPTGAINTFCGLTDCRRQGDPNIDTAPWFLGMVNGAHHIPTGLDYTNPPTNPPNFLSASPFGTKSHCIAIGDRPTASDRWSFCPIDPADLFTPKNTHLAPWLLEMRISEDYTGR